MTIVVLAIVVVIVVFAGIVVLVGAVVFVGIVLLLMHRLSFATNFIKLISHP